ATSTKNRNCSAMSFDIGLATFIFVVDVRFGSKATFRSAIAMSALGQKRTCAAHTLMSALPLKATLNATYGNVRFGPKADIRAIIRSAHRRGREVRVEW